MFNFTGLKFEDGTEVEVGDLCVLVERETNREVFKGRATGAGGGSMLRGRGYLDDGDSLVPANMMKDTHYLVKVEELEE